eukprot:4218212-Prymnesium_polylepis.2
MPRARGLSPAAGAPFDAILRHWGLACGCAARDGASALSMCGDRHLCQFSHTNARARVELARVGECCERGRSST